ncbi:MAG: class II glutamine amidotransferase [Myxococcales bacterium]|nr:class II glutamine amidotransferase [Myxococcales bacterium]
MTRLVGFFSNQGDRLQCATAAEREALGFDAGRSDGWGVGSYHAGEVIVRKRPGDARASVGLAEVVEGLRAPCAVAHVRRATAGARSLENTHPFRFRRWLFAHLGTVMTEAPQRRELHEMVPEFLARSVHGQTDSEWLFHHLLAGLWETGRLDDDGLERAQIVASVRGSLDALDARLGLKAPMAFVLTQGHVMLAFSRGVDAAWVRRQGVRDCPACKRSQAADEALKYFMFAAGGAVEAPGWRRLPSSPEGAFVSVDGHLDAAVTALE